MAAIRLGEMLLKAGVINEGQLKAALVQQKTWGGKIGETLVRMQYCSEDVVCQALSRQLNLPLAALNPAPAVSLVALDKVPVAVSKQLDVVPLAISEDGKSLAVAMSDPLNLEVLDALRARTGCRIVAQLAGRLAIARVREQLYGSGEELDSQAEDVFKVHDAQGHTVIKQLSDLQAAAQARTAPAPAVDPKVVELLTSLEGAQRNQLLALKALAELLVDKGVTTREAFSARSHR